MPVLTEIDLLKLSLLANGVSVEDRAGAAWREMYGGPLTLADHATTVGITMILPGSRYVNAPIVTRPECLRLDHDADGFFVRDRSRAIPVTVVPVAAYHNKVIIDRIDGKARPMYTYGATHTDRCRVSPIAGCAWNCRFCDLPYALEYRKKHVDDLLDVIEAARDDRLVPARHVIVSGGTPRGGAPLSDEDWIDDVYAELAARSPLPVEVMMAARRDVDHPAKLRKAGVSAISINLEVSDPVRARLVAPQKAGYGRQNLLDYIERAVEVFGVGSVQSLIVVGAAIEPYESVMQGVRDLVDRGCIPVLSPFRPHPATPMRDAPAATVDELLRIYLATLDICERTGFTVLPGPLCVACHHNVVAFPLNQPAYIFPSPASEALCVA